MLIYGISGFGDVADPPLHLTDRTAFLTALHHAARQVGARVGKERGERLLRSYFEIEVTTRDDRALSVLVNNYVLYVACSERSTGRPVFTSCAGIGAALAAADPRFRVCEPEELNRRPTVADLEYLGDAELR